ncbi:hypothetical protein POG22_18245 [Geitlerinema sp. CS-897]|nr:hypothetical protein [Geitlerinema sp. CS-897]
MNTIVPFFLIVNEIEICFHGMARSGNHAAIDWIIGMSPHPVDYWNNVANCPKKIFFRKKQILLRSHENRSLSEMSQNFLEKEHDNYFGKSRKRFNVLLLRDPFNLFASRLKQVWNQGLDELKTGFVMGHPSYQYGQSTPSEFVKVWKEHAREFLGITSYLSQPKVLINYNRWVTDRDYRIKIASDLELSYQEETLQKVVGKEGKGTGSSFDRFEFAKKASKMKVFERWKAMQNNANYRSLFEDTEVWDLSQQIFGEIAGTEVLYPN